jgi:positive regulator of sigma E activity
MGPSPELTRRQWRVLGLALESILFGYLGVHSSAVAELVLVGLAVPFIVAFTYPETSSRPLEEISPER